MENTAEKFLKKKGTWPHLNPRRAQNPEVFIQFFPLDLEKSDLYNQNGSGK